MRTRRIHRTCADAVGYRTGLLPTCVTLILAALVLCTVGGAVRAESPRALVERGNRSYASEQYDEAIAYYEKASVRDPESPIVALNTGNAYYRKGDFGGAREHYEDAALKARDISLEAKAWYNTGNCAFREGERQVDSDLEKALEFFQESVQLYTTALEKDPGLVEAAHNIEVARLIIKDLLDRIKNQEEQMQRQQERLQGVVDSLRALITRQEKAAATSRGLDEERERRAEDWNADLHGLEEQQERIAGGTSAVQDTLNAMFPDSVPVPVEEASSHLDSSLVDQDGALNELAAREPGRAVAYQDLSLDQLKKALEALTEDREGSEQQDQPQQGSQQQSPQEQQEKPKEQQQEEQQQQRDETAQGILDEEKENREKRQQARQSYRSVDKDW